MHPWINAFISSGIATAGVGLKDTPYILEPKNHRFKLRGGNPNSLFNVHLTETDWWNFAKPSQNYFPERLTWDPIHGFLHGGVDTKMRDQRVRHMRRTFTGGSARAGQIMSAMQKHSDGDTPRSFVSLANEENFEFRSGGVIKTPHSFARHVLGSAKPGIRNQAELAMRAAFKLLPGGIHDRQNPERAGAWTSQAAADAAVSGSLATALAPTATGWGAARRALIKNQDHRYSPPDSTLTPGSVVSFESTNTPKSDPYPKTEYPEHHHHMLTSRYRRWPPPVGAGLRRLFPGHRKLLPTDPGASPALTADVSGTLTKVRVVLAGRSGKGFGWVVYTAYPL